MARSIEQLIDDLKQHDWTMNGKTAHALAEMGRSALPRLLAALGSDDGFVRTGAAIALGTIGDADATEALLRAVQWRDNRVYEDDEDREARAAAAIALGKLRDPAACTPLMAELEKVFQTNSTLASHIAEALGEIGDQRAIPALVKMVAQGDFETQKVASWALAQMGEQGLEILLKMGLDRTQPGRQSVVRALGTTGSVAAVQALLEILRGRDDEPLVRGEAARAIGRIGKSPAIMPALLNILETPEDEVRSSALMGLGLLRDPAAYAPIIEQLNDINLRYVAAMALGDLGDPRACEILISILKSTDQSLRFHAVRALGKIGCSNAIPMLSELLDRTIRTPLDAAEEAAIEATMRTLRNKEAGDGSSR